MRRKTLPDFEPPTVAELRAMWRRYANDPAVCRLILTNVHLRRQIVELERLRGSVLTAWNEATGGSHLVALYQMRLLLQNEIERAEEPQDEGERPKPFPPSSG
jgi:hypothetical protein